LIRLRLVIGSTVISLLFMVLLGFQLYRSTEQTMMKQVDQDLLARGVFLENNFSKILGAGQLEALPLRPPFIKDSSLIDPVTRRVMEDSTVLNRPRIFDLQGKPLLVPFDVPFDARSIKPSTLGQRIFSTNELDSQKLRVYSVPILDGKKTIGIAQISTSLEQWDRSLEALRNTLFFFSPLVLLASVIGGLSLTHFALRPIQKIANAAESIEGTNLSARLPSGGKDEFGKLSRTFNALLERLEQAFNTQTKSLDLQKRFTADASHELKTPLTALKTRIGLAKELDDPEQVKKQLVIMDEISDRMKGLILGLLTVARADDGKLKLELDQVRISALIDRAIRVASSSGGIAQPPLVTVANDSLILCDSALMTQALANVIQNAMRYMPADQPVRIEGVTEDGHVTFRVIDQGPGIAAEDIPFVFDRFYRSDLHRSREAGGVGLGLAITKAIVESHHGSVDVASRFGHGCTFTLTIPLDVTESKQD
jgi:signal transduction histidine kinase